MAGAREVTRRTSGAPADGVDLCDESELGYLRSRTQFREDSGLTLDEHYRFAHLPLVAPEHPDVIAAREGDRPGTSYVMGRHARTFSLVVPIPAEALLRSEAYRELESDLKASPFANKLAWDLLPRRQDKLHATICGSLREQPVFGADAREALARVGPIEVELRGLFSGNVNVGRLYLRAYPERRAGQNVFRQIQRALGRSETDLYVVGLYNLVDHLSPDEATALSALIDGWWDRPILQLRAESLWLLGSADDLVLDSEVTETIRLTR
jgi:hypothetical protein